MLDLTREDDAHIAGRLETETIAWLGTTRPDGRPHLVPVWFAWDDPAVLVYSPPAARKVRNLQRNPACTLALESADLGNDVAFVEGDAELVGPDHADVRTRQPHFAQKYAPLMGETTFEDWFKGFEQPVVLRVTRIVAWSKPVGELRYRVVT